ncbi:MAG: hypothetical protein ABRQ27_08805 [Clostridiaceae bacterium]
MRRVINFFGFIGAMATIIIIIATFLTSYRFVYVNEMFSGYYPLQVSLTITMFIWSVRFWLNGTGKKRYIYFVICLLLSLSSLFFASNLVK